MNDFLGFVKSTNIRLPSLMNNQNSNGSDGGHQLNHDELEILKKIEAQNRILEADTKSLKSISSEGRRHSTSSDESHTSMLSTGVQDDDSSHGNDSNSRQWQLWGHIVNDWEDYKKKNGKQLKEMIRCGIPPHFRGLVWQLMCNAHNSDYASKYSEYLKQVSPSEKIIRRDIARTFPEHEFFKKNEGGQEVLFNVIKAYSLVDREVGYCQGSAFIAGLLLVQMPEEEAFAVFVALMQDYRLRELFKPSMAELGLCMYQLECLVQEHAPELVLHFQAQAIHTSMFASGWFLTLFATTFDFKLAQRILDVFILEGMEIIFRIGLAILLSGKEKLLQMDMENVLKFVQKDAPDYFNKYPDNLFNLAYSLVKYNPKKMKKLEKGYLTMKNKELEEQVEMRRLRTENTLLRQRISGLELENGNLADKLIQDRVNRALEAEEKIIMGKELSIAKRKAGITENGETNGHHYTEEFVENLRREIDESKSRETALNSSVTDLKDKVKSLESQNRELVDESRVAILEEELIAAKLREAEANTAMKELTHKLNVLEENWQNHLNRANANRKLNLGSKSNSKLAYVELQEEIISAKVRETKMKATNIEFKQRLLELETTNQVCTSQLRRSENERTMLQDKCKLAEDKVQILQRHVNDTNLRIAHVESKNQEAVNALRLREIDSNMKIAELERSVTTLRDTGSSNHIDGSKSESSSSSSSNHFIQAAETNKLIQHLQSKLLKQQQSIKTLNKQLAKKNNHHLSDLKESDNLSESDQSDSDLVLEIDTDKL